MHKMKFGWVSDSTIPKLTQMRVAMCSDSELGTQATSWLLSNPKSRPISSAATCFPTPKAPLISTCRRGCLPGTDSAGTMDEVSTSVYWLKDTRVRSLSQDLLQEKVTSRCIFTNMICQGCVCWSNPASSNATFLKHVSPCSIPQALYNELLHKGVQGLEV